LIQRKQGCLFIFAVFGLFSLFPASAEEPRIAGCTLNGIKLYGKVQVVESFPDFKVQIVESFPDLNVQTVNAFPDVCGKWQFVESFPDFRVQFVTSFPDLRIRYVTAFPGVP